MTLCSDSVSQPELFTFLDHNRRPQDLIFFFFHFLLCFVCFFVFVVWFLCVCVDLVFLGGERAEGARKKKALNI